MLAKFKQLGKESLIYGVAGMLNKFIAFFLVPLYTHVFTQEQYGLQGLVVTVITLAGTLAVMGMDSAAHNWYWQTEIEADRRVTIASWFWCQLLFSLLLGAVIFLSSGMLSVLLTGDASAAPLLRLGAFTLPLNVCHGVVTNYFRLKRRAKATMCYSVVTNLMLVGMTILFILVLDQGLAGFFIAQIVSGVITTIAGAFILRGVIGPRHAHSRRFREMLPYALPLVPAAFAFWALGFADRLFVEKLVSTEQVAVYQLAATLASGVAMISGAFTMAWGPFAYSLQRQPDAPALYGRMLPVYLAVGGIFVGCLAMFSREAVQIMAPESYSAAAPVAALLSLGVLANGLSYIAGTGLALARSSSPITAAVTIAAAVNLLLNILLIPAHGITGAAWAAVFSWTVYTGFIFWRAQKIHPIPYQYRRAVLLAVILTLTVCVAPRIVIPGAAVGILSKSLLFCFFVMIVLTIAVPGWTRILRGKAMKRF